MSSTSDFLSTNDKEHIVALIAEAEKHTTGEIRIHLENWCWADAYNHAKDVFIRLGMDKTEERSGVLIYVAVKSHKAAIVGDSGINDKVPDGFWSTAMIAMLASFKENRPGDGLAFAVKEIGSVLAQHFPKKENNEDELSNEISFGQ